jgi:hypothetical protein
MAEQDGLLGAADNSTVTADNSATVLSSDKRIARVTDKALSEAAKALSVRSLSSRRKIACLNKATRKALADTLVILDGKYLIATPSAARLAALCDLRVDYTVDRFRRGLPCSPVEQLIGATVCAANRMITDPDERRGLSAVCNERIRALERLMATYPSPPTRRWAPDPRRSKSRVGVTGETTLPVTRLDAHAAEMVDGLDAGSQPVGNDSADDDDMDLEPDAGRPGQRPDGNMGNVDMLGEDGRGG